MAEEVHGKDILFTEDGAVYHLGLKKGQLSQRIITCGPEDRAKLWADTFLKDVKEYTSQRNYFTFTGTYKNIPVSIVAIGMGAPNMDIFVREGSFVTEGKKLAIVRIGTCGTIKPGVTPGTLCLTDKIHYCHTNYSYWNGQTYGTTDAQKPYIISGAVDSDQHLTERIAHHLSHKNKKYERGTSLSAETFYACQGRTIPYFDDENKEIVPIMKDLGVINIEMESHELLHLCKLRNVQSHKGKCGKVHGAALAMVVVNRVDTSTEKVEPEVLSSAILNAGEAALEALIEMTLS